MGRNREYVRACPRCGSKDVWSDFSVPAFVAGGFLPYRCDSCGHTGSFFPEVESSSRKKLKGHGKKELVPTSFGKGYGIGAGRIFGPYFLAASFIALLFMEFPVNMFFFLFLFLYGAFFTYLGYLR